MGRSVLAVIAGLVATVVLSTACDAVMMAAVPGAFEHGPSPAMMAFGVCYTLLAATAGGFIAALIARRAELMHALVLGTLGAISTLVIIIAAPATQRTVAMLVSGMLVIPATVLGGWMRRRTRPHP